MPDLINALKEIDSEKPDHRKLIEEQYVENLQVKQLSVGYRLATKF
jgi:hypothetical protein